MKRTTILVSVIVAVTFATGAVGAENAVAETSDAPSAELKVLYKFVGNWRGATTTHKTMSTPKEIRGTSTTSCEPVLGGRFTLNRAEASNGESGLTLTTYDVHRKCYRMWWFGSQGIAAPEMQGHWNPKTQTMDWRSENDDGATTIAKGWYEDDDTAKWTVITKLPSGEIGFSVEGKETRVKQLPKRKDAPAGKPVERSAEQKVLDMLVGDWKGASTALKAAWTPKEARLTDTSSCVRILGGRFTESKGKVSDGTSSRVLTTYDKPQKC